MIDILNKSHLVKEKERKLKVPIDFDSNHLEYYTGSTFDIPEVVKKTRKMKQKSVGVNKKNNKNSLF